MLTNIGLYLHDYNKAEIYYKTGISASRLSLLSNDPSTRLYADELYLICLSIDKEVGEVAKEIFKDISLKDINLPTAKKEKLTEFGEFLIQFLNSQKSISEKTGIPESRFSSLIKSPNAGLLAQELYLTALAINKEPGEVFRTVNGHLTLKTIEEQNYLKTKSKEKDAVRKKK